ncbi:hypothetical protein C8R41DRAFT_871797 [Lentinula lateritia]|uniref:Uncharacterized protein n=1 Tax=Lentinula lateritia TaxID=40482 RepID=A0ABQ8UY93_9AGAR|nr:hypothetical protein C8R41DRAFT_871797 [Lentinula lateritia]
MDIPPCLTRARARVGRSDEDIPAPHHSSSLWQSILGPPPGDATFPDIDGPATPPPTQLPPFVQPVWIVPRPSGEEALRARNAIRSSRSNTQASAPAERSPNVLAVRSAAAFGLPMAQDDPPSDEEWFGVRGSDLYEPNDALAPSGEEGSAPFRRNRSSDNLNSPGDDGFHRFSPEPRARTSREELPGPEELSPSVQMWDFDEVVVRPASAVTANDQRHATVHRGPFRDPSLASIPGHGLQPAPEILPRSDNHHPQRGRTHQSHRSQPRARTREPSPGPDFGAHLRRPSRSLSPIVQYPPARFDPSSLRVGREQGGRQQALVPSHVSAYPLDSGAEQRVPVKNGRRFRDPHQGEISSTVPAAMLNHVISALRTGWPSFISLNYFSRRMSEIGESTVSAAGETWDVDDAGQVKFKSKCLRELSFESISRRDWDSISKNVPRALMDYFIPPGECGIRSELAYEISQMFKRHLPTIFL